jgi:oligopeptide/dipeptide ABC transporter ATP-binding protein
MLFSNLGRAAVNNTDIKVAVRGLRKHFRISKGRLLKAVDGIDFNIRKGRVLGLVGESGCGKTTIGRLVINLIQPTSGDVLFDNINLFNLPKDRMRRMRQKMQIVFQDPYSSLNPRMTIGNILSFPMKVQGLYKKERKQRVTYLLDCVGLRGSDMNRYPHEFSGGQLQRIGLARALAVDPEFIVADEPVSALDVSIQSQVLNLFKDLKDEFQLTCLFISHDLSVVEFISDHIAVVYLGKIVEIAPSDIFYKAHQHPYSKSLLSAIAMPDPNIEQTKSPITLEGEITSPINPPPGCRFYSRCFARMDICQKKGPELVEVEKEHFVSCFAVNPG